MRTEWPLVFLPCPQNAECVALFPLPLPKPGFYADSMTKFVSCVPAAACPGVNASAVAAAFSIPAASGALRCVPFSNLHAPVERAMSHSPGVLAAGCGMCTTVRYGDVDPVYRLFVNLSSPSQGAKLHCQHLGECMFHRLFCTFPTHAKSPSVVPRML
jgi:hypothetical protein